MKKLLVIAAFAILFFSCQKEIEPTTPSSGERFTFKASIENLATKADINSNHELVWAANDKIGVYVNDESWTVKNQPFTLSAGEGTTQGDFTWDNTGSFSNKAAAAFYPWDDNDYTDDGTKNNVYEEYAYFTLNPGIYSYSSGKMLTPLVAPLSGSTDDIHFKHAGAAVKVHINNVPKGAHSIGMSVNGQQITGEFKVKFANAGTDAMIPVTPDATKNTVWLNIWNGSQAAWDFIFPVPELTLPKLSFQMYDDNDILIWSKNLKAQTSDLGRGDILVMPAISVSAYKQFDANAGWGICGTHNNWAGDTKMVTDGKLCIAKSVEFVAGAEFKVRTVGNWGTAGTDNFGWSQVNSKYSNNVEDANGNIKVTAAGMYDIIFNSSESPYSGYNPYEIRVVQSKCPYPLPQETASITIDGAYTDWDSVTAESAGNTTVKVVSDNTNVYFYVKITGAASDIWDNGGGKYVYALFDLDGNPSNDVEQWGNKGDFVLLLYPYAAGPAIVTSSASSDTGWICQPTTSPYTVANISLSGTFTDADESGKRDITYEFSIPRADMPTIPSTDPITITIKGSKISSNVSISRKL